MSTEMLKPSRTNKVESPLTRSLRETPDELPELAYGWRIALSDLAHMEEVEEALIAYVRRGFARSLRGRAQAQADAIAFLDSVFEDHARHGTMLFEYVGENFGPVAPLRVKRRFLFEAILPILDRLSLRIPGVAALFILCYEQASLYYHEYLTEAARKQNRLILAEMSERIRLDRARHIVGWADLLRSVPITGFGARAIARILVAVWRSDVSTSLSGWVDGTTRDAYQSVGFETSAYLDRVETIRDGMLRNYALPESVLAEAAAELRRVALPDLSLRTLQPAVIGPSYGRTIGVF